jgi:hypothetical protein
VDVRESLAMESNEQQLRPPTRARWTTIACVALAITVATIAFHVHSYWWCETLTLCDVRLCADEGLASLQVPLCRLAAKETAESNLVIYKRSPMGWNGVGSSAAKTTLRGWMRMGAGNSPHAMFADFGYWKGGWQSESRPGPFIVVFTPVWFVGLVLLGAFLLCYFGLVRFRLRTILVAFAVAAGLLCLLTLRAPS